MFQEFDLEYDTVVQTLDENVTSCLLSNEMRSSVRNWLTNMTQSYTQNTNECVDEFTIKVGCLQKQNSNEVSTPTMEHSQGMCLFVTHVDRQLTARHIIGYDDDSLDDTYWLFADFFPRIALPVELYAGKVVCCGPSTRSRIVLESGEGMLNFVCVFLKTNSKQEASV